MREFSILKLYVSIYLLLRSSVLAVMYGTVNHLFRRKDPSEGEACCETRELLAFPLGEGSIERRSRRRAILAGGLLQAIR